MMNVAEAGYQDMDRGHPMADRVPTIAYSTAIHAAAPDIGSVVRLMVVVGRLARGPGGLSPTEYFAHRLWHPDHGRGDLCRFAGLQGQARFHAACCDLTCKAMADDKLVMQAILEASGNVAVPEIAAVVHPHRGHFGAARLRSLPEIHEFMLDPAHYPFVAKPIAGMFSVGVFHAVALDAASESVISVTGTRLPIMDLATRIFCDHDKNGYLIQRALEPAHAVSAMSGGRLCTVRALVLLGEEGAVLHRAALKIPIRRNVADNYWREGNRLGAVDVSTGQISRVVTGKAEALRLDPVHPDTGVMIAGMALPDWSALCDLVQRVAPLFPGIRTQSWDIALTDRGPVVIEVNWGGDLHLHQFAHGYGSLDPVYCDHLRACGYRGRLPE
jgi:hypothetical protein